MIVIASPEPDTYGQYARASLLADYVELLALKGQPVKRAVVADFLADNGWDLELVRQPRESMDEEHGLLPDRLDEAQEHALETASIVFRQMEERRAILDERYPFVITDEVVSFDPDLDHESSSYVAMLTLTVAHAFKVDSPHRPETLFERIVARALENRGLSSTGMAAHRREGYSFEKALHAACEEVGLRAAPDTAPRLAKAHDEGVDVLCHIGWERYLRPSSWVFIGQVTVGRSDTWSKKIKEPSPQTWARFVGIPNRPLPFLAVPHHVERSMMEKLACDGNAVVLDRLRLVRFKGENDAEEREIIKAVAQEEVEPLAG